MQCLRVHVWDSVHSYYRVWSYCVLFVANEEKSFLWVKIVWTYDVTIYVWDIRDEPTVYVTLVLLDEIYVCLCPLQMMAFFFCFYSKYHWLIQSCFAVELELYILKFRRNKDVWWCVDEAKEAGYSEPNPWDDLSGTDVAWKVDPVFCQMVIDTCSLYIGHCISI